MRLHERAARREAPVRQPDNGTRSDAGSASLRPRGRAPVVANTGRRGDKAGSPRKRLAKPQTEEPGVNEYVVRVQCSGTTLYAFVIEDAQRFITYDRKPRMVTHDDALEIQERLPTGPGHSPVSVEKMPTREM